MHLLTGTTGHVDQKMYGDVKQVMHDGMTFMVYVQFVENDGHTMCAELMRFKVAYQT